MEQEPKRQLSDAQIQWIKESMDQAAKLREADNKKLLWLVMGTEAWKNSPVFGIEGDIFSELENRLYPEYDGDLVTWQEWGWKTPEGDIRYL